MSIQDYDNRSSVYFQPPPGTQAKDVIARIPEDFQVQVAQVYERPFDLNKSAIAQWMASLAGVSLNFQGSIFYVWMGSDVLKLSFSVEFVVESNPNDDLKDPIRNLFYMCAPIMAKDSTFGNLAPPNYLGSAGKSSAYTQVKVGQMIWLPMCIITSVITTFHKPILADGTPSRATVGLEIITPRVFTTNDVEYLFIPSATGGSLSDNNAPASGGSVSGGPIGSPSGLVG